MLTANRVHQFLNSAREWDALLRGQMQFDTRPASRIAANDHSILFEIDLPGIDRENLSVEVEGKELIVSVAAANAELQDGASWKVRERQEWVGEYRFEVPFQIAPEESRVQFVNGVLSITVQKAQGELPRKLDIK